MQGSKAHNNLSPTCMIETCFKKQLISQKLNLSNDGLTGVLIIEIWTFTFGVHCYNQGKKGHKL